MFCSCSVCLSCCVPVQEQMGYFAQIIEHYQPGLTNVFAWMDGLSLAMEDPPNPLEQNAYYTKVSESLL
jgi:hypothetical protein